MSAPIRDDWRGDWERYGMSECRGHFTRSLWTGPAMPCERCQRERCALYYTVGPHVHHLLCALCILNIEGLAEIHDLLPQVPL